MKVVIIEDEHLTAERIITLLLQIDPGIEVISIIDSVKRSVEWFNSNEQPDLIFMDIQLADGLSFDVFDVVNIEAPVIFITAFQEYAIKHNEISREHPLVIGITSTGNGHVIVKNNLQRREVSETSLGTGLENLRKQITYFSSDSLLVLEEADAFIVRMPTVSGNTGVK